MNEDWIKTLEYRPEVPVEAQAPNPENPTSTLELRRLTLRTTKILQKRPDPPREVISTSGKLSWKPPQALRGEPKVTHYNIYANHEFNRVRQVPADQLFIEDNLNADQVYVSAWNETNRLESIKVRVAWSPGSGGGGGIVVVGDPEDGDVPIWDEADNRWEAGPPPSGGGSVTTIPFRVKGTELCRVVPADVYTPPTAWSYVQNQMSTVDNTKSVTFISPNTAGNLIVVAVRYGANPGSLSDSNGNMYQQVLLNADTVGFTACWIAPNCAGGPNTLTLSNRAAVWALIEYSGIKTVSPLDGSQVNGPGMTITATESAELLLAVAGNGGQASQPTQVGSDYFPRAAWMGTYGGTPQGLAVYERRATTPAVYTISFNFMVPSGSQGVLMGLKVGA